MKSIKFAVIALAAALVCAGTAQAKIVPAADDTFASLSPKTPKTGKAYSFKGKTGFKVGGKYSSASTNVVINGATYLAIFSSTNGSVTNAIAGTVKAITKGVDKKKSLEYSFGVLSGKSASTNRLGFGLAKGSATSVYLSIGVYGTTVGSITNIALYTNSFNVTNYPGTTNEFVYPTNIISFSNVVTSGVVPFSSFTNRTFSVKVK